MYVMLDKKNFIIVELRQSTPQWLAWRRGKITASMAGMILGLNKYKTPLQLYNQILCGEEDPDNEFMKHGRDTEPEAREWVLKTTGKSYAPVCMESTKYPWMAASLDGWNEENEIPILEIKCPQRGIEKFSLALLDEIPPDHFAQIQHQMAVSGADKAYYCTYSKNAQDGVLITIKRDNAFIEKMIEAEEAFYRRVIGFYPPDPIDGRDIELIDDPELANEVSEYIVVYKQFKNFEKLEKKLKEKIVERSQFKSIKVGDFKVNKSIKPGNVDYKLVPELQGVDLTPYRKENIVSWRIS